MKKLDALEPAIQKQLKPVVENRCFDAVALIPPYPGSSDNGDK